MKFCRVQSLLFFATFPNHRLSLTVRDEPSCETTTKDDRRRSKGKHWPRQDIDHAKREHQSRDSIRRTLLSGPSSHLQSTVHLFPSRLSSHPSLGPCKTRRKPLLLPFLPLDGVERIHSCLPRHCDTRTHVRIKQATATLTNSFFFFFEREFHWTPGMNLFPGQGSNTLHTAHQSFPRNRKFSIVFFIHPQPQTDHVVIQYFTTQQLRSFFFSVELFP
ncbi:MAG: hypothetical protein BYD32DRAFT_107634 [Podila humilis]|nr:MAG: hypothetical protein BYD32DRAFT_107634 [Podila humilis]